MAQFTTLDDASVASLATAFGLGELESWSAIAAGTVNSNFAVRAGGRRYFLRINEGKTPGDVRAEAALVAALRERGIETPAVVPSASGESFVMHEGKCASLFEWIDGEHRDSDTIEPEHCEELGRELAALHSCAQELAAAHGRRGIYTLDQIEQRRAAIDTSAHPEIAETVEALGEEIRWVQARRDELGPVPRGVVHGDLFPDNALFREGERMVVLDWEQASTDSLAYDLAVSCNAWCFGAGYERARHEALVGAYVAAGGILAAPEHREVELRAAAARFTVTRLTDIYLQNPEHPGKDFRRFWMRLETWRELGAAGLPG